jgi:hypothetical protein
MNEDEKKTAINILATHIRETRPYLFQLSARHDEELGLIAALAEATGSKVSLLVRCRESGEMRTISIADYRPHEMVVSRAIISDPLCLALEEAGARIVYGH